MKTKSVLPIFICLSFLLCFTTAHAKKGIKWRTYEIVKISENSMTIKSKGGTELIIDKEPKDYKVGDKVRYNKRRNRMKKYHPKRVY